jgi:chromosome segregation ATPase
VKFFALQLIDFQAHQNFWVKFSPGINTIKGPTDAGKSSVLRALRWLCLNDFPGDAFIRDGAKKTQVNLTIRDDSENKNITRVKGAGINLYEFNAQEFKAFATSVPSPIQNALAVSEINFAGQHDSPFWFSETAGEVSRRLNAVIDLSVIDNSLAHIASKVRAAQVTVGVLEIQKRENEEELSALADAKHRIVAFKKLKAAKEKQDEHALACDRMERIISDFNSYQTGALDAKASHLERMVNAGRNLRRSARNVATLEGILDELARCKSLIIKVPSITPIEQAFLRWQELDNQCRDLARSLTRATDLAATVSSRAAQSKTAEKRLHSETEGKNCPLCGQPVSRR